MRKGPDPRLYGLSIVRRAAPGGIDADRLSILAETWTMIDAAAPRDRQPLLRSMVSRVTVARREGKIVGLVHVRALPGLGDVDIDVPL